MFKILINSKGKILLIFALILILLGVLQFIWVIKQLDKHMLRRPSIFLFPILGTFVRMLWLFLLFIGLYFICQVHHNVVFALILFLTILMTYNFKKRSLKNKAKIIINLYKEIRKTHPETNEVELLKHTARIFLEIQGYEEIHINSIIKSINDGLLGITKINDIENLAIYLLYHVHPSKDITPKVDANLHKAVLQALRLL